MNENNIEFGLWSKTAKTGTIYYTGKATIDGTDYWVKMFDNSNKTNPKAPDFRIILEEVIEEDNTPATETSELGW